MDTDQKSQSLSFSSEEIDSTIAYNDYGGIACRTVDEEVLNFSQVFYNGEIWGVDAKNLAKSRSKRGSLYDCGFIRAPGMAYFPVLGYCPEIKKKKCPPLPDGRTTPTKQGQLQ